MAADISSTSSLKIFAWAIFLLFILGFFVHSVGAWTGPILGVWFVGTQRPMRGFVWLMLFATVPSLVEALVRSSHASSRATLVSVAWILIAALLSVWPLTFHRVVSPLLPGLLKTLPFPLAAAMSITFASLLLPAAIFNHQFSMRGSFPLAQIAAAWGIGGAYLLKDWFAALVVRIWNRDFKFGFYGAPSIAAILSIVVLGLGVCFEMRGLASPSDYAGFLTLWEFLPAALFFAALGLLLARRRARRTAPASQILDLLRSPATLEPLLLLEERDLQVLASPAGERFPIRNGIPMLLRAADMTGLNRKYNHLYETIAGFYDDTQRVAGALSGFNRDEYVMSYLGLLEVKPGDAVLETSVGTGLNFKYLPRGVKLFGLDLSGEMLVNCEANLRRWGLDANLFQGNAEHLPFADSCFDVVFHVGGINFFNDRAAAIEEMIRVAKPGSLILIADETEEHVQSSFETAPLIGLFFKNRKEAVAPPVDLLPRAMQEVRLTTLNVIGKNRFYALTFRKPAVTVPVF
jgi:ubiquinone/menaquinone biosynthesis C-methylase UbiE